MHGHGRGTHLGMCLVQLQCVSCVVASAACVTTDKSSVLDFITPIVHVHGRGTRLGTCLVHVQCVSCVVASAACVTADKCSVLLMMTQLRLCTGMDEARALVRALCNSSVSRVSLLCSMFQCFHFLVGRGHARGMRLGTRPVYAACGVAFVADVTGAGWRCPQTLYACKQRNDVIRNNTLLLQTNS